ncbi:MAG TPA: nitrous oxide-stimulated promoter family protein [Verrucomicrobiae bacterium]|nr:nitrous oxide-stimulated promoter family protein [Verrucomicrobiae bacterium]
MNASRTASGAEFARNTTDHSDRFTDRRLARGWKTMLAMIRIYCRGKHGKGDVLCDECQDFTDYAANRLDRCRFGAEKPTCANCPVHCYQRHHRDQVKVIMRYAGPRMLWTHPVLSLFHWLDGYRKAPSLN